MEKFKPYFLFFFCIFLYLPINLFAKSGALLHEKLGTAFVIQGMKTRELLKGEWLDDNVEILTEEGSQITLLDADGNRYHLAGSGHMRIQTAKKQVELKRGFLWLQMLLQNEEMYIETVNSVMKCSQCESIISFDQNQLKSQSLVINGNMWIVNKLLQNKGEMIPPSHFSFIDTSKKQTPPRIPTPIGYQSYQKILSLFKDVSPHSEMLKEEGEKEENKIVNVKKVETNNNQKSNKFDLNQFLNEQVKETTIKNKHVVENKKHKKDETKKLPFVAAPVMVKIHWANGKTETKNLLSQDKSIKKKLNEHKNHHNHHNHHVDESPPRAAARSKSVAPSYYKDQNKDQMTDEFDQSLKGQMQQQKRHSSEVNQLIEDLESFKADYKTNY